MAEFPRPAEGIVAHALHRHLRRRPVAALLRRVLGGEVLHAGEPTIIALANSWIVINVGGPPTDDKPTVTLQPPHDPIRSAASSTSASPTSTRSTSSGAHEGPSS